MNAAIIDVAARLLPIIIILGLGNLIRFRSLLSPAAIEELKGLVVTIALPAVLFGTFLNMELDPAYLTIFGIVLLICVAMYGVGFALRRSVGKGHEYYPFLMTGFEFGMVGIPLFGAAYGLDAIGAIAIVDLSHELFIWFVFVTLLTVKRDGGGSLSTTLRGFAGSPLIIAIVSALALNLLGLGNAFSEHPASGAVLRTLDILGGMLIPVILIIVGYGMRLSPRGIGDALRVVIPRFVILVPLALVLNRVLAGAMPGFTPAFEAALFTFLILPPPYVVPLFMPRDQTDERAFVNNVLSVYTLGTLLVFVAYFSVNPVL